MLHSASRVGPTRFVYGLEMTEEMLALALQHTAKAGVSNVAFLKGRIEAIPLPANSVGVVISNCVINLASDTSLVLQDALRVLKPGGRFAVSDVLAEGPVPEALRRNMEAWVGCLTGALEIETYRRLLVDAGFEEVGTEIARRYTVEEAGLDAGTLPTSWQETARWRVRFAGDQARKRSWRACFFREGSAGCRIGRCVLWQGPGLAARWGHEKRPSQDREGRRRLRELRGTCTLLAIQRCLMS